MAIKMTTRVSFEHELENLKNSLDEMSLHVEHSIDKLFNAMEQMDSELAEYLYKNDRVVNDMERSIESQCLSIITRQQPVAGDLRLVSSALKVVTDIERIGDHAVDIAELILRWNNVKMLSYFRTLLHWILLAILFQKGFTFYKTGEFFVTNLDTTSCA